MALSSSTIATIKKDSGIVLAFIAAHPWAHTTTMLALGALGGFIAAKVF